MANRLSMAKIHSIETLHASGHSNREIARLLGVNRGTVNDHVRRLKAQKQPDPHTGTAGGVGAAGENRPDPHTGSSSSGAAVSAEPPVLSGPKSLCEEYRETIEAKLDAGLSIQRIHQDLKADDFAGSYYSVMRFVHRLGEKTPVPVRRMETAAGEEAQSVQWGATSGPPHRWPWAGKRGGRGCSGSC